jgi:hypothetical protein
MASSWASFTIWKSSFALERTATRCGSDQSDSLNPEPKSIRQVSFRVASHSAFRGGADRFRAR